MKYSVEMVSGAVVYIPSSVIQKIGGGGRLKRRHGDSMVIT